MKTPEARDYTDSRFKCVGSCVSKWKLLGKHFEIDTWQFFVSENLAISQVLPFGKAKMIKTLAVTEDVAFVTRRSHIFTRRGISLTNFAKHCKFYAKMK